ncbi:CUB domain, partial [Cinara cedri]
MNVVIFSFYYCAVGVLLQGIVGKNNITTNTALGGISVSSWYIPHEGLIKNNKTPEICYDHNSKPLVNKYECDSWTKGNSMHITSPRYPQPFYDLGFSEIFLQKVTVVRLLRLDFIDFKMALPNSDTGVCETDRMVITNGDIQYVMCGPYTNQH